MCGQICRAGAGIGPQCAPRRDRTAQAARKGAEISQDEQRKLAAGGPASDRRLHQAHRRGAGAEGQGDSAGLMAGRVNAVATPRAVPRHVAIIMDGNGRWAKARGLPRIAGHRRGAEAARPHVIAAAELGIPYLTLFGFSSENWKRPSAEIQDLMALLRHYLVRRDRRIASQRRSPEGDRPTHPSRAGHHQPDRARRNRDARQFPNHPDDRIVLWRRAEIVAAVRAIAAQAECGRLAVEEVDEDCIARHLFTAEIPDPDLLIRTSGEQRISNFSALAKRLFRTGLHQDAVARFLQARSGAGDRRILRPRTPVR